MFRRRELFDSAVKSKIGHRQKSVIIEFGVCQHTGKVLPTIVPSMYSSNERWIAKVIQCMSILQFLRSSLYFSLQQVLHVRVLLRACTHSIDRR
jgi:hypothetical protein